MNVCPRSRWITRLAASMVAASLLTTPSFAEAAPKLATQSKQMPKASKKAFAAGKKAFDSGDFARAGDEWAGVLAGIDESAQTQGPRMRLVLDTIATYREAYAADGNIAHLQAAMDTYYGYFKAYKAAYGTPSIPRPVVEARHELKDELDEAKDKGGGAGGAAVAGGAASGGSGSNASGSGSDASGSGSGDATNTSDSTSDSNTTSNDSSTTQSAEDPSASSGGSGAGGSDAGTSVSVSAQPGSTDKAGTPLIAAGAVVAALGIGASSLIAVGAINGKQARADQKLAGYTDEQRDRIDEQGKTANSLFIAGLVATPVLVGTGVALIVVGVKKRKQSAMQASIAPMLRRGVAGVSVSGRF